jgi:hypothetical protein
LLKIDTLGAIEILITILMTEQERKYMPEYKGKSYPLRKGIIPFLNTPLVRGIMPLIINRQGCNAPATPICDGDYQIVLEVIALN